MLDDLRPYPDYKDSGVPWLMRVPAHWNVQRLKREAEINPSKSEVSQALAEDMPVTFLPMERVQVNGLIDTRDTRPARSVWNGFTYFRRGDVLIAKITPCFENGKGACLESLPTECGFGWTEFIVLRTRGRALPQFLYRITTLPEFRTLGADAMTGAAGQQRVPQSFVENFPAPFPPIEEQSAIVRFLDHSDRLIRRFIAGKRRLIALLNEQKQAIIQRAVTRGLDTNVRLKPSGIEWIGDTPEHWEVKRLKWVTRLQRGYDLPQDNRKPGMIPVVSSGGIIDTHSEARATGPGVVIGRYGSTDAVFFLESDFWPHNTALFVTDFQDNEPRWCFYLLRAISKSDYAAKSAVPGVDRKDLYEIYVPRAPRKEQVDLIRRLEERLVAVDSSIEHNRREIDLVREYRTRLISDVVTGKLDVRGVALPELEESEEPLPAVDEIADAISEEEQELEAVEETADAGD